MKTPILISDFTYDLPDARIAKFPLDKRDESKFLIYDNGEISHTIFRELSHYIDDSATLVFNNTKVVRARLIFYKPTGARIEVFCLEPSSPADYERAFAKTQSSTWHCMVGNAKKFNAPLSIQYPGGTLTAQRSEGDTVNFDWTSPHTFGELLELLGRIPIPPYLCRESEEIDKERYQTTYAKFEGSVAAPTAGLHFTSEQVANFKNRAEVTLHVGAGTFLPVKELDAVNHEMHVEFFNVHIDQLRKMALVQGEIIAVGTTSVRTLESLAALGQRVINNGTPDNQKPIGQWETYENGQSGTELAALLDYMVVNDMECLCGATQIMITPGYKFRTIKGLITNFHQPQSTLLLLISAVVGDDWRDIYQYAMDNDFRFLSYGDSSLLMCRCKI